MVQIKETDFLEQDKSIKVDAWLIHIAHNFHNSDLKLIQNAVSLAQLAGGDKPSMTNASCLQEGLATAEILHSLKADAPSIAAALVFSSHEYADLEFEDIKAQLGEEVAKLIIGVATMSSMHNMQHKLANHYQNSRHVDNIRKMLVAMVEDVRVVLIKLAERTVTLHAAPNISQEFAQQMAQETLDIYAPLANRLGVNQIKWQLEDLSFRFLMREQYHNIAKSLAARRLERERFVQEALLTLKYKIKEIGIQNVQINGRAKHIYSIYRKMQRKNVGIEEIYDALAVRVLTESIEDCYAVLGIVHATWPQIPKEFDDYIATPKPNGYQSIHTAVIGPGKKSLEVQIRTYQMHGESELGVAAHWHYKQGGKKPSHEGKIAWLRQVLDWQKEISADQNQDSDPLETQNSDDRIYVFTPQGEIKDLPVGATPLDFAYSIHTEVGHRCRGAKVNGSIVPLNYHLKTGEQIEILTCKHPQPSRDWINPHHAYLISSRARARVLHWFKQQDYDKNVEDGQQLVKEELNRHSLHDVDLEPVLKRFNFKAINDLYAAVGCGDIRCTQIIGILQALINPQMRTVSFPTTKPKALNKFNQDIYIAGVGDLLTHLARCCQPVPGENIIGYITRGKGVSIHRQDCVNILHASESSRQRFIEVFWGNGHQHSHAVDLSIDAYDRKNLMRDITNTLANDGVNVTRLNSASNKEEHTAHLLITIEINDLTHLSRIMDHIKQIPNIIAVKRNM